MAKPRRHHKPNPHKTSHNKPNPYKPDRNKPPTSPKSPSNPSSTNLDYGYNHNPSSSYRDRLERTGRREFLLGPQSSDFQDAHKESDTDSEPSSLHHTLGLGPNQAAPGNHTHKRPPHITRGPDAAYASNAATRSVNMVSVIRENGDHGMTLSGTNRMVCSKPGLWDVRAQLQFSGLANYNQSRGAKIWLWDASTSTWYDVASGWYWPMDDYVVAINIGAVIEMDKDDWIQLDGFNNTAQSLSIAQYPDTWLQATFLGE